MTINPKSQNVKKCRLTIIFFSLSDSLFPLDYPLGYLVSCLENERCTALGVHDSTGLQAFVLAYLDYGRGDTGVPFTTRDLTTSQAFGGRVGCDIFELGLVRVELNEIGTFNS